MSQFIESRPGVKAEFIRVLTRRFTQFSAVGLSGFLLDSALYGLLVGPLAVPHSLARAISYWIAATSNWFWNRQFAFGDAVKRRMLGQWSQYMTLSLVSFVPSFGTYYVLTHMVPFFIDHKYPALVLGVGAGVLFNFVGASMLVFRLYGWLKD